MAESALAAALAAWADQATAAAAAGVFAALVDGTVLLPVRATVVSGQVAEHTGLPAEKEAELAVLTVTLADGRRVLPAFTSAAAMRRWRIEARPVEAPVRDACRAATDEGWDALVLDPGGADFPVAGAALRALATGFLPVAGGESLSIGELATSGLLSDEPAPTDPAVLAALRRGLAREPTVAEAWLLRVSAGPEVGLTTRVPLDPAGLATVAARLADRLADARLSVLLLDPATAEQARLRCVRLWP